MLYVVCCILWLSEGDQGDQDGEEDGGAGGGVQVQGELVRQNTGGGLGYFWEDSGAGEVDTNTQT